MRPPVVLLAGCLTALVAFACSDTDPQPVVNVTTPTAPTPPPQPACVTNNLATVSWQNLGEQYVDVIWDGQYVGTLPPESPPGFEQAVAAGVSHRLDWRITNSATPSLPGGLLPCLETRPIPVQCARVIYGSCYGF